MKIVWSDQSRDDLRAIRDFIGRDSEHYAQLQIERIIRRVERVAEMPTMGHPIHEFPKTDLRECHEGGYRIIYRFDDSELQVVTLVHMRQKMNRRRIR
jgi:addiction module RelE/StbE family toxin